LAFFAYGLALSPVLTGLGTANLSILATVLTIFGILLAETRPVATGILLALAFSLKPTVAVSAVALLLLYRCWRAFLVFAASTTAITGAATLRLRGVPGWYTSYRANIDYLFGSHGAASYSNPDNSRFDLLNLQMPFYGMTHSGLISNILAFGITGVLLAVWILKFRRERHMTWPAVASLTLIALLPVYQRNYCAGFVLIAVLWAIRTCPRTGPTRLLLIISTVFLIPGEALLRIYSNKLPSILLAPLPKNLIFAHATWVIVAMVIIILIHSESDQFRVSDLEERSLGSKGFLTT
jgi:hypothetical protein